MAVPITIPLINPNELEALVSGLHVREGQRVRKDAPICTLETTKSTTDLCAEISGFVVGLILRQGESVRAGDIVGYLAETSDWVPPDQSGQREIPGHYRFLPDGVRITQPALSLAQQHHLDLSQFPVDTLITEALVRATLLMSDEMKLPIPTGKFDHKTIVIYGAGGHGKSVLDLLNVLDTYQVIGFVDDGVPPGENIMGVPVLGNKDILPQLYRRGLRLAVNAVGGIGNVSIRQLVFQRMIEVGFDFPVIAHHSAFIEPSAVLSPGVQVFPHAYVGSEVRVGFGSIVNTGAIVSHECILGDLVNISPGAILAGGVEVKDGSLIGMGVAINLQVRVGSGARIGNNATVNTDVPDGGVVQSGTTWSAK
jgi:acetyltransferase EpsM